MKQRIPWGGGEFFFKITGVIGIAISVIQWRLTDNQHDQAESCDMVGNFSVILIFQ